MFDSSWSSIFFRLANFAVLGAVGYYAYRRYLKGSLEEKVAQKEAVLKGLEEQGFFLEGRAEDLDEQRKQKERETALLKQKVDEWHDAVIAERHKVQDDNRIFAARNAERISTKNAYVAQHELKMRITPIIMHDAKELLQSKFSDKNQSEQYLHEVLAGLKRRLRS